MTSNIATTKQYRSTINLPNKRGHFTLTTEENPETLLNSLLKNLDGQLFYEGSGSSTTFIHWNAPDGKVCGHIHEQIVPRNMSSRFYNEARDREAVAA